MTMPAPLPLGGRLARPGAGWSPARPALLATAFHEGGHAVVARVLGIEVVRASAMPGQTGVRTRFQINVPPAEYAETVKRLLLVDLSGQLAEYRATGQFDGNAWRADERNALRRALQFGLWTSARLDEAEELVERWRPKAAALVEENWPAIERVAAALAAGAVLDQAGVDALMVGAAPKSR